MVIIIGMDVDGFLASLESLKLATGIRDSLYLFPLIESFHVLGLGVVFGSIVIVDLLVKAKPHSRTMKIDLRRRGSR